MAVNFRPMQERQWDKQQQSGAQSRVRGPEKRENGAHQEQGGRERGGEAHLLNLEHYHLGTRTRIRHTLGSLSQSSLLEPE